jgi:hypothetical protein
MRVAKQVPAYLGGSQTHDDSEASEERRFAENYGQDFACVRSLSATILVRQGEEQTVAFFS